MPPAGAGVGLRLRRAANNAAQRSRAPANCRRVSPLRAEIPHAGLALASAGGPHPARSGSHGSPLYPPILGEGLPKVGHLAVSSCAGRSGEGPQAVRLFEANVIPPSPGGWASALASPLGFRTAGGASPGRPQTPEPAEARRRKPPATAREKAGPGTRPGPASCRLPPGSPGRRQGDEGEMAVQVSPFPPLAGERGPGGEGAHPSGRQRDARVRDASAKRRDPPAVWRGSPPLQTVVSSATEPQPDPGAAGGTPEPWIFNGSVSVPATYRGNRSGDTCTGARSERSRRSG